MSILLLQRIFHGGAWLHTCNNKLLINKYSLSLKIVFIVIYVIFVFLSLSYINNTWITSKNNINLSALSIANSIGISINGEMIKNLRAQSDDKGTVPYISIKNRLIGIKKQFSKIKFAYIYRVKNNRIYFMADSEPEGSTDYSPPGQEYTESPQPYKTAFMSGEQIITEPVTDRWGTWITILIPLKDQKTGNVFAVFGMDYPADSFYDEAKQNTFEASLIVFVLSLIIFAFYLVLYKNRQLKISQEVLSLAVEDTEKSEQKYRLLIDEMQLGLALHEIVCDDKGKAVDYRFISINKSYERVTGLMSEDIIGKTVLEVLPKTEKYWIEQYAKVAITGESSEFESYSVEFNKYFHVHVYSPEAGRFAVIIDDVTERKRQVDRIEYLSFHDHLTGLYNRRFYEEELSRLDKERNLPITILMGDVNGLKLINDSFGHAFGDELLRKAADAISKGCRADDIVARYGGDEFIVLLPKTDPYQTEQIIKRIKTLLLKEKIGGIDVSISFGYGTKYSSETVVHQTLKIAEDSMYSNKLYESPKIREKTVDVIIKTLHEKNKREEMHSHRVSCLCEKMAKELGMSEYKINEIKTLGLLHDIGKIAIDENILNKSEKLSELEWKEIKRHPEIGHRILCTVNEMSKIAEYILAHHERWDGNGYPRGLKEKEIPFESRILAVADAYDAMISERTYGSVMNEESVIAELQRNAGTQFDAELVNFFIERILRNKTSEQ